MWRPSKRSVSLAFLLLSNLYLALAIFPILKWFGPASPANGWEMMCQMALLAAVPTQCILAVGWAAMGQRHWTLRIGQAALGVLLLAFVAATSETYARSR